MTTTIAHRRSAELEELIGQDAAVFRILTGDRLTGRTATSGPTRSRQSRWPRCRQPWACIT
jgi:hypothetical protein